MHVVPGVTVLCFAPSSSWMRTAPWETCWEVSWMCRLARSVSTGNHSIVGVGGGPLEISGPAPREGVEEMLCSVRGILWAEGLQPLGTLCLSTWPLCMLGGLRCWVWGISPGPKHLVVGGSPLCCAEELFKRTPNLLCHVSLLPQGQKALYTSGGCKRAETRASLSSQTWAGHEGPSMPVPSHCGVTILLVTILLLPLPRSHPPRGKEQPPVRLLH